MEAVRNGFNSKEEDELPELSAGKKLKSPNSDGSAILNYQVLQNFFQDTDVQEKESCHISLVHVDAIDFDGNVDNATPFAAKEENFRLDVASKSKCENHEEQIQFKEDNLESRSLSPELELVNSCHGPSSQTCHLSCGILETLSRNEPVDPMSDDDESMKDHCPSSPASDIGEDGVSMKGQKNILLDGDSEMADMDVAVVISPDYIVLQDKYCTEALVAFSHDSIKIKCSTIPDGQGRFNFEWGVDDIIDIECQWFQRVGFVILKFHMLSKDAMHCEDARGAPAIEELRFAVADKNWSQKQEEITSLNVKYLAVWDLVLVEDVQLDEIALCRQRRYFPNFDEPFEEVVYPKGDSDAVSISKRDVDLLQPGIFINDTIIDFYIKYLKNQMQPEEKQKFHFFNSFFFRKLADLDKDPSSISDGRAAFLRVQKWTRKVDLFGKDYIFIPVNFSLHWSLIVICHPGEVASFEDEDLDGSLKVPCILHMDSIKGNHAGLKNLVQRYLYEEWKERHKEALDDISSKFLNLRFVTLELPQQENLYDCGLFLLHYLELFLNEAPVNFSPFKLSKFSNFLNSDWFPPSEASLKRTLIQKLIFGLIEHHSQETSGADHHSPRLSEDNGNEACVEFLQERCHPSAACHGNLSNPPASRGIEMTLLAAASDLQSLNESGLVLKELLDPGATSGSLLGQFESFVPSSSFYLNGTVSPREQEDAETREQLVYLTSGGSNFRISGITHTASAVPLSSRGFGTETPWNPELSMQGENEDGSSSPALSASDDSEDIGIIENNFVEEAGLQNKKVAHVFPSVQNLGLTKGSDTVSNLSLENPVSRDSCGSIEVLDENENQDLLSYPPMSLEPDANMAEKRLHQDTEMVENKNSCSDVGTNTDNLSTESPELQPSKRLRLTTLVDRETGFVES